MIRTPNPSTSPSHPTSTSPSRFRAEHKAIKSRSRAELKAMKPAPSNPRRRTSLTPFVDWVVQRQKDKGNGMKGLHRINRKEFDDLHHEFQLEQSSSVQNSSTKKNIKVNARREEAKRRSIVRRNEKIKNINWSSDIITEGDQLLKQLSAASAKVNVAPAAAKNRREVQYYPERIRAGDSATPTPTPMPKAPIRSKFSQDPAPGRSMAIETIQRSITTMQRRLRDKERLTQLQDINGSPTPSGSGGSGRTAAPGDSYSCDLLERLADKLEMLCKRSFFSCRLIFVIEYF